MEQAGGCSAAEPRLPLERGTHISIIGNTLADRMQHDGWLETLLHAMHPDHDLVIRNLGFAADEVQLRPRSDNFGSPEEWLTRTGTNVALCFFGYNEALRGASELGRFRGELKGMIEAMRAQKYDGQRAPLLVVFSPIAHENLQSPHLPSGAENNEKLALYTEAMREVCAAANVVFVDLFAPTRRLYDKTAEPLTINGVHLNEEGNRLLASEIATALFGGGQEIVLPKKTELERLRRAVLNKNLYWFSRYRVLDGYNVFGGRSTLSWEGQSNADVLRREMEMFDVMTANRDRKIWAVARGNDLHVADDNIPPPLTVKTNKPGDLPDGRYSYLGGVEAIEKMQVAPGMEVNLFASEEKFPELVNPVQMAVDPDGRLFVATWPSYPHWQPMNPRSDRIVCLPDEDADGAADQCVVFADNLNSVTGFEFWGGGMLVSAPPELWFLKDTDGDERADVKVRMVQGLPSADTHHTANAFVLGVDGALYWSQGIFNVTGVETPTRTFRSVESGVYRFDPRTYEIDFHFPIGPNPHGNVVDQWGYQFANDGTSGTGSYVNIGKGRGHKEWFVKRVRPVAATGILSSSHFPERNNGNFLICNTIGVLGVLQHQVKYEGADIRAEEIEPIVVSSDPNFRPADIEIGGDGALYVADWCNALIGHMQHNIRDPNRDHSHGRIYRITSKGRPLVRPPKLKGGAMGDVLQAFLLPENGVRYRARLELSGRPTSEVLAATESWARNLDVSRPDHAQAVLECLWVYGEHRVPNIPLAARLLAGAADGRVRAAAVRAMGLWSDKGPERDALLLAAAVDGAPLVRAEVVKAAVAFDSPTAREALFRAAEQPTDDELNLVIAYAHERMEIDRRLRAEIQAGNALSPAAYAFALKYAPLRDLLLLEPTEDVYRAIVDRAEASTEAVAQAMGELAKRQNKSPAAATIDLLADGEQGKTPANFAGLAAHLLNQSPAELGKVKERLQRMAASASTGPLRAVGYAGWALADDSAQEAYRHALRDETTLREFLGGLGRIPTGKAPDVLYDIVRPLLFGAPAELNGNETVAQASPELAAMAVQSLNAIAGREEEKARDLAQLLLDGTARDAAVASILNIPAHFWPRDKVRSVAEKLAEFASALPAQERTSKPALAAMELTDKLAALLPEDEAALFQRQVAALRVQVIRIGTTPHRMVYDKERIVVQAGSTVEFLFTNPDSMPHNFSIVEPGALEEIGELGEATSRESDAMARHYVPKSAKVLLSSRLLQPGESQALSYAIPKTPSVYPYVCTYPGHWRRMYGALYVVENLHDYLADQVAYLERNPLEKRDELLKFIARNNEWSFDQIAPRFASWQSSAPNGGVHEPRNYDVGKSVFKAANCVACHRLGCEGNAIGPDLAKLDPKKKTPEHILRSILEPSKEIAENFQPHSFELDSGLVVTGLVVEETADALKVVVDPIAKPEPQIVEKSAVLQRRKSDVSTMPAGMANRLTEEELLDLIAYVLAGGEQEHGLFAPHDHVER